MASTQSRTLQLIRSTLTNDVNAATKAPGGIFQTVAPAGSTTTPWVVYQQYTVSPDIQGRAGQTVMGRGVILALAVGPASQGQAIQDCADWIDSLLNPPNGLQGVVGGTTIIRIVRQGEYGPVDEVVQPAGVLWTRTGFLYNWWAQ